MKKILKNKYILVIFILITTLIVYSCIENNKINTITENYSMYSDSLSYQKKQDSLSYVIKIKSFDSSYNSMVKEKDSSYKYSISKINSTKIYNRIIYKDSIKETYIENTELYNEYKSIIVSLKDSITTLHNKLNTIEKDSAVYTNTENTVKTKKQEIKETTQNIKYNGDAYIQFSGDYDTDNTLLKGVKGEINYSLYSPLYIGSEGYYYSGDKYLIEPKIGLRNIGPLYGYLSMPYDGKIHGKLTIGANFKF